MSIKNFLFFLLCFLCLINSMAYAHGIDYKIINNKAIILKITYSSGEALSFGNYEISALDENIIYQKGRTDKNGIISFVPDKKGIWRVVVTDESEHGIHKRVIELKIDEISSLELKKNDLSDKYLKIIAGVGFIVGIFGFIVILKYRGNIRT